MRNLGIYRSATPFSGCKNKMAAFAGRHWQTHTVEALVSASTTRLRACGKATEPQDAAGFFAKVLGGACYVIHTNSG